MKGEETERNHIAAHLLLGAALCGMSKQKVSQTSFSHISINSLTILTVSMAPESP